MLRKLPPLNALRAFEAAARHQNLSRAAKELNVTQAAVSYQVKLLEERIGVKLFYRHQGGLKLTPESHTYFSTLRQAFDLIGEATDELIGASPTTNLTVSTYPNFAMSWLLPRLHQFSVQHSEINLAVVTSIRTLDFEQRQMDVAVRWGAGWAGLECHYLFSADMLPVCSPSLLTGPKALRKPKDLANHTLLHVEGSPDDWRTWLDAVGVAGIDFDRGPIFDSSAFAQQAAIDGAGVAMGRIPLVDELLRSGRLVAPFREQYRTKDAWYLVFPKATASFRKVKIFTNWIMAEARKSELHVYKGTGRARITGLHFGTEFLSKG